MYTTNLILCLMKNENVVRILLLLLYIILLYIIGT